MPILKNKMSLETLSNPHQVSNYQYPMLRSQPQLLLLFNQLR